jgi:AraC-like DNA-binding protein
VLKEVTGKTTRQLIAERIASEARALLKHTNWNISEIAWCLGFEDTSNFVKFFKKNSELTPHQFRI